MLWELRGREAGIGGPGVSPTCAIPEGLSSAAGHSDQCWPGKGVAG